MIDTYRSYEQARDVIAQVHSFMSDENRIIKPHSPTIWSGYQTPKHHDLTRNLYDQGMLEDSEIVGVTSSCIKPNALTVIIGKELERKRGLLSRLEQIAFRRERDPTIERSSIWLVSLYEDLTFKGGIVRLGREEYSIVPHDGKGALSVERLDSNYAFDSVNESPLASYDPTTDPWANGHGKYDSFLLGKSA